MIYAKKTAVRIVIETDPTREGWGLDLEERVFAALCAAEKRGLERAAEALDRAEPSYCTELYRRGIRQAAKIVRTLLVSTTEEGYGHGG